ncbi:MAG TPA: M23 family metallopeptidase [Cellvibrionaceae bacterium]
MNRFTLLLLTLSFLPSYLNALELEGSWQQGAVIRGTVAPDSVVEFQGERLMVSANGEFVLGLGRDAEAHVQLLVTAPKGDATTHVFDVARRDYPIQRIEGVPQRTVTPSEDQQKRTREEAARVWQARQARLNTTDFMADFIWPVTGRITGVYGSQRVYNGEPRSPHYGVDIARPTGTPVVAPAAGQVIFADDDLFYSGGTLIIDHGHGLSSTLIHLSKILVAEGERVEQGQLVAEVGASGRATGPHLDWRMNWFGERVDPTTLVGPMPEAAAR